MEYKYWIYGLVVQSQIPLPELQIYDGTYRHKKDVRIYTKDMPKDIKEALDEGKDHCFKKDKIWFSIKDTATYYIKDIDCIEIEVFSEANEQSVKTFLLGSALGMLLIMRKSIAIHGGAVVINEKGIILTGDSGAGKSTLTAALREKGYDFLADDVSAIDKDENNNIVIMPGYPQQKLCSDAVDKFKYRNNSDIRKIDEGRDKYAIRINDNFRKTAVRLKAIYELITDDVDSVKLVKVTGKNKLITIFKNIFRFGLIDYIGMDPLYFRKCLQLAKNIETYRIIRPKEGYTVEKQIEVIESSISELVLQ
ncbi:hypothetical protein [Clostridium oryzae]|uniref:HPr kinase/phosphorylase n=1 Tax=Clostridium oryzae TaxID=1450648 RepID=A0A1V4ITC2_9CLOT|nr:hypothetical protein [Clostridium oryzae]OPJ62717.1 HPr kinase/phosphorylase [Clostridium oryzae]